VTRGECGASPKSSGTIGNFPESYEHNLYVFLSALEGALVEELLGGLPAGSDE